MKPSYFMIRATETDAKDATPCNRRGLALCRLGRHKEGNLSFDTALRIDPHYLDAQNNKGVVFYKQKRYAQANGFFDAIIRADTQLRERLIQKRHDSEQRLGRY